jgi:hypothetical protein
MLQHLGGSDWVAGATVKPRSSNSLFARHRRARNRFIKYLILQTQEGVRKAPMDGRVGIFGRTGTEIEKEWEKCCSSGPNALKVD